MFSLLVGLWDYLFSKAEVHVLIIGLDYAGKTTLLEQLKSHFGKKPGIPLEKIPPTVGLNTKKRIDAEYDYVVAKVDIKRTNVIFWDLGGQERLRAIWSKYYSESHGLVFVLDAADPQRFGEAKNALEIMLSNEELYGIPILILSNKNDLENATDLNTIGTALNLGAIPTSHETHVQAISALSMNGVEDAVNWLIGTVKNSERFVSKQNRS
ncbi:ADP-ribosylation factor-related protein [Thraustotheca clavata]|uniref:ADP-ribosylation factor-related protein n=1 Tax=Thraustotheca clavata TaxID=74557 RepID=A0A1W0A3B2_9STRA|nr:ADP-ribosylation factor-related protein [Thraustotheca clavata]